MAGEDARFFSNYPTAGGLNGLWSAFPHPLMTALGGYTNPIQQFFESQTGAGTPVRFASGHDLEANYQRLLDAGMNPDEAQRLIGGVATERNRNGIPLEQVIQQAQALERQRGQLGEVNKAESAVLSGIDPMIQRLERFSQDPNAIRMDAEYAPILAGLESRINAGAETQKRAASTAQARSGGGALSGIGNRSAIAAETGRQRGLEGALSGLYTDALGRLDTARRDRGDVIQGAANQRAGILGQNTYNPLDPWSLNVGIWQNRYGQAQQPLQMGINALTGIAGVAGNQANAGMSNIMGLGSMLGGR